MANFIKLSIVCVLFFFPLLAFSQLNSTQKNSMINLSKTINSSNINWDVNKEPCSWKGIKCSPSNSTVIQISLSKFSLSSSALLPGVCEIDTLQALDVSDNHFGEIPDKFVSSCGRIGGLKLLNFSRNRLVGILPKFVGFAGLEVLDLSYNLMSGSVGLELEGLDGLRSLNLSFNNFSGSVPTKLGNTMALKEFVLSGNSFGGTIPEGIFGYRSLTQIDLSGNSLSGSIPAGIGELSKLELLVLSANKFVGEIPPSLLNISTLSRFAANLNGFNGTIPGRITQSLRNFDLSYNRLTGSIPPDLLSGPNLQTLDLSSNSLVGNISGNISISLVRLRLGSNLLEGEIPSADFSELQQLMYVELDNNRLAGSIPSKLGSCKSLALLNLAQNHLVGVLPPEIGNLSNLQVLKLQFNRLSGEIPVQITQLHKLLTLNMSSNSLTGRIPPSISSLQNLINLNLNLNSLSGSIPDTISVMNSLLELQLGGNRLRGPIPKLPPNLQIALNLSSNLFDGPIPSTLSQLTSLEVIDLSNNKFSGEIPEFLTRGTLAWLLLSNNNLSGALPKFSPYTIVDWQGNEGLFNTTAKPETSAKQRKRTPAAIIALVVAISVVAVVIVAVAAMILSRRYGRVDAEQPEAAGDVSPFPQVTEGNLLTSNAIHRSNIDFSRAMESVSNPANGVLKTRFSTYYKAAMPSGSVYFVKKLNLSDKIFQPDSLARFGTELEAFGKLSNSNIMAPLAYVLSTENAYLFYEYSLKGTLFDVLHSSSGSEVDWASRYSIAIGVAQGLAFLHGVSSGPILLLDLSSRTIFLKSLKEPRVGDIELYKVIDPSKSTGSISTVAGSVGYIPPEYAYTMRVTAVGNVYSFGVILLELVTGKPAVSEGTELAKWVLSNSARQDKWDDMLDVGISRTSLATKSQMVAVMKIALGCVSVSPEARPKMKTVLRMLLNAR